MGQAEEKIMHLFTSDLSKLYNKHQYDGDEPLFLPLWHYTSANGLMGIIRSNHEEHGKLHFWFTRSDCLNDTSEGNHVLTVYQTVCEELYQNGEISEAFYNSIIKAELSNQIYINYAIPSEETNEHRSVLDCVACHAFICSFSLKEDSLDMWRYYSKGDGGYGLKLSPYIFDNYREFEYDEYEENRLFSVIRQFKVIYENQEKKQIIKDLVLDAYLYYHRNAEEDPDELNEALRFIQSKLKEQQFRFKHECYSSEQEYRFIFYRPYSKPDALLNKLPEVHYRNQNGVIIPYLDITIEPENAYLMEVLISPFIESEIVLDTTMEYLSSCGFNCETRLSKLPVRK